MNHKDLGDICIAADYILCCSHTELVTFTRCIIMITLSVAIICQGRLILTSIGGRICSSGNWGVCVCVLHELPVQVPNRVNSHRSKDHIDGILPKGPYPPSLRMADRALLAGYHVHFHIHLKMFYHKNYRQIIDNWTVVITLLKIRLWWLHSRILNAISADLNEPLY